VSQDHVEDVSAVAPSILVDTNIVIYLLAGGPKAEACAPHLDGHVLAISFQSVGELWYGAIRRRWGDRKRRRLEDAVQRLAVLTVDEAMVRIWAELRASSQASGFTKQVADLWIAATAKRHGLPLITNDRDFLTALDVEVIRPEMPEESK
jgi:tRNA(fMet)-specific endonuclease VapC